MATKKARRGGKHVGKKTSRGARRRKSSHGGGAHANGKLPKNAVTLVVILKPREGQELMLEAELHALLAPSRKEEGCLRFDLHRVLEGPAAFLLHEVWDTREHHTSHTKTDHYLRWNARKDSVMASREAAFWKQIG
jgi:quinol monooxygenase YgiN